MSVDNPATHSRRHLFLALGLSFFLAFLFVVSIIIYTKLAKIEDPFSQLDFSFVIFIFLYTIIESVLILRIGIMKFGGLSLRSIGWRIDNVWHDMSYCLLSGSVAVCAVYLLGLLIGNWDWTQFVTAQNQFTFANRILFLLIGLNAGFVEESLFRGFLQPTAIQSFGFAFGLIFIDFIFAAYYLNFHPQAFLGKFILGLIFGSLRSRDQSLPRPDVAHAFFWTVTGSF